MKQNRVLNLQLFYLPITTLVAFYFYWVLYRKAPNDFMIFCLAVPALFGALAIGLCSDKMKFWSYNVPDKLKLSGSSSHLMAIWYVSTLNLSLLLLSESLLAQTNLTNTLKFVVSFTALYALLGTFLDFLNVESGLLVVRNRATRKNLGTVKTVMSYGPYYFGLVGLIFAIESKMAHYLFIERQSETSLTLAVIVSFTALCVPFVMFFSYIYFQTVNYRKKNAKIVVPSPDIKNA